MVTINKFDTLQETSKNIFQITTMKILLPST